MREKEFVLKAPWTPTGDQPQAIAKLVAGLKRGEVHQTLLGATGTGKTYTAAQVIAQVQRPTLVLSHNKTLAAQLCSEFQRFFPENAVSYFVSYYDYYQPEAYIPHTDTYIEKDASINEEIEKFRHAATMNLLTRRDVLIVASVSCIYGLGNVSDYRSLAISVKRGDAIQRDSFLRRLTDIQYKRSRMEFKQGMFHVLGDTVEVFPPSADTVIRIEMPFDEVETIQEVDSFTGELIQDLQEVTLFPASHNVTTQERIATASERILAELKEREVELIAKGEQAKAERLRMRTEYDVEMLKETGYCTGIENYVRHLGGAPPGSPPSTLLDYFPKDFLLIVDESHISIPQVGGMAEGNFSRKQTLVDYGFRLPSAHDNRPLKFSEFEKRIGQRIYVSATPGPYEFRHTPKASVIEQIIRPTGLLDPAITVKPTEGQVRDILREIAEAVARKERVLITTLTKKTAEKLTKFLADESGIKVRYLHSDIETLERIEILRQLRKGDIDVLVGINLLREGLDLPEVSFIAIIDADKPGFLRSRDALIQTIGRAARNVHGHVTLYGDRETSAMKQAIAETDRRRTIQQRHNEEHGITPRSIEKAVHDIAEEHSRLELRRPRYDHTKIPKDEKKRLIAELEAQMEIASENLDFERAADLRDEIEILRRELHA